MQTTNCKLPVFSGIPLCMPKEDRGFYSVLGIAAAVALIVILLVLWAMHGCARKHEPSSQPTSGLGARPPARSRRDWLTARS